MYLCCMPTSISSSDARSDWANILNRAGYAKERFVVERHDTPIAAVVSMEDLDMLEEISNRAAAEEALRILADSDVEDATTADDVAQEKLETHIQAIGQIIRDSVQDNRSLLIETVRKLATACSVALPSLAERLHSSSPYDDKQVGAL